MGTLVHFPRHRARDKAVEACAEVYEEARAMGVWQRSKLIRETWEELLARLLRKVNR